MKSSADTGVHAALEALKEKLKTSINTSVETSIQFSLIERSLSAEYLADFPYYVDGLARGEPDGFVLTPSYVAAADVFLNIPLRTSDVWVITFPKCGNIN